MDYGEMIESMDDMVGKLVKKIDQLDLRDDTVILFTGDNGTAQRSKLRHIEGRKYEYEHVYSIRNGKRLPGGKGTLLDIGTNVPLIASWPGNIQAGSRGHELVDFSDWLPTLARLARAKPTQPHDGVSFTSALLHTRRREARTFAFAEHRGGKAWVRTKQYKLYRDGRYFDIQADPMEKQPLKNLNNRAASDRKLLEAALLKLNYPATKK